MKLINRIILATKFIFMPEHKEKEIIITKNFMHNHFYKNKICIRCKDRESMWYSDKCNRCSDIGILD